MITDMLTNVKNVQSFLEENVTDTYDTFYVDHFLYAIWCSDSGLVNIEPYTLSWSKQTEGVWVILQRKDEKPVYDGNDYNNSLECQDSGNHMVKVDSDGYCAACGYRDEGTPN